MKKYPPDTDNLNALADFFDHADVTGLADLEEVQDRPHRGLVSVTVRLPKEDVEELKRRAARMGLGYTSLIRAAVRRFVGR
ncbi:MAG: ribbon-helix-helix protein, CopG family [Clostridia bacterium]|nr:MAG: ribbon-helix-helix protein, CopG family [Clostridia bacterium]